MIVLIGARVHDRCDPRHTGHVESIMSAGAASKATVRWESTGWLSYVALGSLVVIARSEGRLITNDPTDGYYSGKRPSRVAQQNRETIRKHAEARLCRPPN